MFKVIFLDMDNTIAENQTCHNVQFADGLYEYKRPISFVVDAINSLFRNNGEKIVIVTVVQGGDLGKQEKLFWLAKIDFEYDDVLFVGEENVTKSSEMMRHCREKGYDPSECLLIDDKKSMLQDAEQCGFQVMYPQQLLVEYYEWLQNQK